jgi:membrane fusion protein, multidrug efflux system
LPSEAALIVPQQAVQVDQAGAFVLVIDNSNKVQVRRIVLGPVRGAHLVVRGGLAPGERVLTEGIQKVRPEQVVQPTEVGPEA